VPFGLKTVISGGGYGSNLGLQEGNSGLSEGGLLSTASLMVVPLALYLAKHGQLVPRLKLTALAYWGIAALAIVTAIGTYERSALLGLLVLGFSMWMRTKHRISFGVVIGLVAALVLYTTSSAWNARISTIGSYQSEGSAMVRILVWKWTLGYAATHPLGGGFMSYLIDHIEVLPGNGDPAYIQFGRAFHSVYFELLGEQGYPGLVMFVTLAAVTFFRLGRSAKRARDQPELQWVAALSNALQGGLAVFLTSGAFVGIAFQPMFWYFIALGVSLNAYMWRADAKPRTRRPDGDRSRPPTTLPGCRARTDGATGPSTRRCDDQGDAANCRNRSRSLTRDRSKNACRVGSRRLAHGLGLAKQADPSPAARKIDPLIDRRAADVASISYAACHADPERIQARPLGCRH
jgi:O-antigen ligase